MAATLSESELLNSNKLPPCPAIVVGLIQALQQTDTTISDIARFISADASLTMRLLKVVNSAYYGLARKVNSVDEAAFRLGLKEVWALAVSLKLSEMHTKAQTSWGSDKEDLWQHALKVGLLAKQIARERRSGKPDELFTAGVLHDMGKLAFLCHYTDKYRALTNKGVLIGPALESEEQKALTLSHSQLGAQMMRRWELPDVLVKMVERHHQPMVHGSFDAAAGTLCAADALIHAAQMQSAEGLVRLEFKDTLLTKEVAQGLNLSAPDCVRMTTDALKGYAELEGLFK